MGDAFIVRRGGGSGLSKCSIIVHAETGSTVAAYSNSAATTKVKDAKEIGTSGSYVITGIEVGTYYAKATKGTKSKISSAITFSAYAVKEVTLPYSVFLYDTGNEFTDYTGGWIKTNVSYNGGTLTKNATNLTFVGETSSQWILSAHVHAVKQIQVPEQANTLCFEFNRTGSNFVVGLFNTLSSGEPDARVATVTTTSESTPYTLEIDVSALRGNGESYYVCVFSKNNNGTWVATKVYFA